MKDLMKKTAQMLSDADFREDMMDDEFELQFEPYLPIPKSEADKLGITGIATTDDHFKHTCRHYEDNAILQPGTIDSNIVMVRARDYAMAGGSRKFYAAYIDDDLATPCAMFMTYFSEEMVSEDILPDAIAYVSFANCLDNALPGQKDVCGITFGGSDPDKNPPGIPITADKVWFEHVENMIDRNSHRNSNAGGEGFLPPNFAINF